MPLERYRTEVELFSTRTTATLSQWGEHQLTLAAVITSVKRQISKKTGKEYARITVEKMLQRWLGTGFWCRY